MNKTKQNELQAAASSGGAMPDADDHVALPSAKSHRLRRSSVLGLGALGIAGAGVLGVAPSAFAASAAPTHGKTTCAIAGDECTAAINYANTNDGGGASVLAVEADAEAHGGAVRHRVFDVRMQTNNGIYNIHVYRNDATLQDGVWWQSRAENQHPTVTTSAPPNSSPDTGSTNPPTGQTGTGSSSAAAEISFSQAESDATSFVTGQGDQVLGVKHDKLVAKGQKDYYQVKLQLGQNGQKQGTTNVWVDATSSPGTVTAASGSGLDYRDTTLVSPAAAETSATTATGGGTAYKTSLHGGKWRWYWVFVRNGSTKYKVGVDAVTGVVTQVRTS